MLYDSLSLLEATVQLTKDVQYWLEDTALGNETRELWPSVMSIPGAVFIPWGKGSDLVYFAFVATENCPSDKWPTVFTSDFAEWTLLDKPFLDALNDVLLDDGGCDFLQVLMYSSIIFPYAHFIKTGEILHVYEDKSFIHVESTEGAPEQLQETWQKESLSINAGLFNPYAKEYFKNKK